MKSSMEELLELVKEKSLKCGDFTLASGLSTTYYFDGRMTTLSPEGAYLVGKEVFEILRGEGVDAIGGPTLGADPIVAAVALVSYMEGSPIPAFIVRRGLKEHGTQKLIEGNLLPRGRVAIVDDVVTTAGSIFEAIKAVEGEGCRVGKVVVLLDRKQGGSDKLRESGYDFTALLSADNEGNVKIV